MTALQAYLQNSKTCKVLSKRPGEAGFSLIELVVVVAVLAILSAIAIPAFTSINNKARASAASNTIATIAKKCAADYAAGVTAPVFNLVTLDGYDTFQSNTTATTAVNSNTACLQTGTLTATTSSNTLYPTFIYNFGTGEKTCSMSNTIVAAEAKKVGCIYGSTAGSGTW